MKGEGERKEREQVDKKDAQRYYEKNRPMATEDQNNTDE
jgi:hypothetical protein